MTYVEFESWSREFLENLGYENSTIEDFIKLAWNLVQKGAIDDKKGKT